MSTEKINFSLPRLLSWALMPTLAILGLASAILDSDSDRPERRPLVLDRTPTEAVTILGQTFANQANWEVRALRPEVGEVQLVHYTGFFRFPDDVLVRLEQQRAPVGEHGATGCGLLRASGLLPHLRLRPERS